MRDMQSVAGALRGIKVIDLSRVLGGPIATQMMGDHGADVIKVEPPAGDETRDWGPPFVNGTAAYFLGVNRNKRAMALDLRLPAGRDVLLRLLEEADVLVENFKIGTLERWGLGYDKVLSRRFSRLIHCRVSGFGPDGPLGGLPGYDAILQAMAGLMSVNGAGDGCPTRIGLPIVDVVTGLNAVIGVLLALRDRAETGQGQLVEVTLFDAAISLLHPHAANYLLSHDLPQRTGNDHPNIAPYSTYRTATRPVYLAVGNDRQFARLCKEIGRAHIAEDARFISNGARVTNREALRETLEVTMADMDGDLLAERLIRSGVPAGPVLDVSESLAHPHTAHRRMKVEIDDYRGIGAPVCPSRAVPSYRRKPPAFAEHTAEILLESGLTEDECHKLAAANVTPQTRGDA